MRSYESSTVTLRAILAHPSLERASIDATMDALAEANADAREIDDAVRLGGDIALGVDEGVDEDQLEAELRALVPEAEVAAKQATESQNLEKRLQTQRMQVPGEIPSNEAIREAILVT